MNTERYTNIMARIDAWAENHEGLDLRYEAVAEVEFMLNNAAYVHYSDEEIAWAGIGAWETAE